MRNYYIIPIFRFGGTGGGGGSGLTEDSDAFITGNWVFVNPIIGSVTTANRLTTPRQISLVGNVTGSVLFDGSTNVTINTAIVDNTISTAKIQNNAVTYVKLGTDVINIINNIVDLLANKPDLNETETITGNWTFTNPINVPNSSIPIQKIQTSNTPASSFFLKGDGTWARIGSGYYEHLQSSPNATWIINHNFGYYPSIVTVYDLGGSQIEAEIVNTSSNQTVIYFTSPTAGIARII